AHPQPASSRTILLANMYDGPGLSDPADEDRFDTDLERTEEEITSAFHKFWFDVVPEFERFGPIEAIAVCRFVSSLQHSCEFFSTKIDSDLPCFSNHA